MTNEKAEKWRAVLQNDRSYDGKFYYAVKSTGIFCRPSCKSKAPLETNVEYFDTARAAMDAGYRPCKRCRPDLIDYQPIRDMACRVKTVIDSFYSKKIRLREELNKIGMSHHRMTEIFKEQYGVTPAEYAARLRIELAKDMLLQSGGPIIEIALSLEFESLTAFYGFFRKYTQMSPAEYRKGGFRKVEAQASPLFWYPYETNLGRFIIAANDAAITEIRFGDMPGFYRNSLRGEKTQSKLTNLAAKQLEEYTSGKRKRFELPLLPAGTAFQKSVWQALIEIPYGETRSYKQIAGQVGNSSASRAVGMANNKNPIPIIIPCHRVLGSNGTLVGYAGGLELKKRLLDLEARYK
jgi:AraC family transcriptional regulator of adaptative response/methylated-DNA-[protein]-cysteine methyltransferase